MSACLVGHQEILWLHRVGVDVAMPGCCVGEPLAGLPAPCFILAKAIFLRTSRCRLSLSIAWWCQRAESPGIMWGLVLVII